MGRPCSDLSRDIAAVLSTDRNRRAPGLKGRRPPPKTYNRTMNSEQWKPVVGFEGQYEVSDIGRVRSLCRFVRGPYGSVRRVTEAILTPYLSPTTNRFVVNIGGKPRYVHTLVAASFLGHRPPRMDVCHVNGNRHDDRACNLRYGTRSENNQDIVHHGRRKLSVAQVHAIREASKTFKHGDRVALERKLGLAHGTVGHILRGRLYGHV